MPPETGALFFITFLNLSSISLYRGSDDDLEHFTNLFEGIRNNKPVIEDPIVGFRAAAPCLAANDSYLEKSY